MVIRLLPGGEYAVLSGDEQTLRTVSEEAWRWLGWVGPHPATGVITRFPAEAFGPLPLATARE